MTQSYDYSDDERIILEILAMLQKSYLESAQPYIDRLVAIRAMTCAPLVLMSISHNEDAYKEEPK